MKPRDIVLESLHHRQPPTIPYTLGFEGDVAERLDAHYGGPHWRDRIVPYLVGVGAVDTDKKETIDAAHNRDPYGGIWRVDRLPWHLEKPPLAQPSFEGYTFPKPEEFATIEGDEVVFPMTKWNYRMIVLEPRQPRTE